MAKVLVACLDNWNTLAEVPFILKKAGFKVVIFCGERSWLKANRFYDHKIDAPDDPDLYLQRLVDMVKNDEYDWVIPGDEKLIKLLNESITDEALFCKLLPLTKIENREVLSSKNGFSHVCQKLGIRTPGYLACQTTGDNMPDVAGLRYPLIIKIDFSWGGRDIKICNSAEEVKSALADFPQGETVIIQEFIKGKEVPVEALFWKGKLIAVACSEILEYDKDEFSYSTRRQYLPVDYALRAEIESFGEKVGVHGFVNMAYIRSDADGLCYIIEADIRPSSWGAYIRYVGNSFAKALKNAIDGKEADMEGFKAAEVALFHKDLRRALYKHDVKGLLRWIYNIKYWRYIPFYDHKLMARIIAEMWHEFVIDKMKRTLNLTKE